MLGDKEEARSNLEMISTSNFPGQGKFLEQPLVVSKIRNGAGMASQLRTAKVPDKDFGAPMSLLLIHD